MRYDPTADANLGEVVLGRVAVLVVSTPVG
jgi:hypothetical protein